MGWITITVAGAVAGVTVAAFTYSSTLSVSRMIATGSGMSLSVLGELVGHYIGDSTGLSVRIMGHTAGKVAEGVIRQSGSMAATGAAVVTGGLTALSITVGTRIVEYSVEYGGKITKEAAQIIADAYLRYKCPDEDKCEVALTEDDWVVLHSTGGGCVLSGNIHSDPV